MKLMHDEVPEDVIDTLLRSRWTPGALGACAMQIVDWLEWTEQHDALDALLKIDVVFPGGDKLGTFKALYDEGIDEAANLRYRTWKQQQAAAGS